MKFKEVNEEVLYSEDRFVEADASVIAFLEEKAKKNKRKRVRLCTHRNTNELIHEMLIIHCEGAYVRPHRHIDKIESFHVVKGEADVVIFKGAGIIDQVIPLGEFNSGKNFYYRLSDSCFHSLVVRSDFFIFHEVTNGPFEKEKTIFADWSPKEEEISSVKKFMGELNKKIEEQSSGN